MITSELICANRPKHVYKLLIYYLGGFTMGKTINSLLNLLSGGATMEQKLLPAPKRNHILRAKFEEKYPLIDEIGLAPSCKVVTFRRFKGSKRMVCIDHRTIEGVAATLSKKFVVRIYVEEPQACETDIRQAISDVHAKFSKHELVSSSPNWVKAYGRYTSVDLLFAEVITAGESEINARLTSLLYHLQKGRSRYLGTGRKFHIVRGASSVEDYDGWMMLNPYKFSIPFDYIKVLGIENFGPGYVSNPGITLKGMAEIPTRENWNAFCKKLNVNSREFDGIVPEVTIKFDNPKVNSVEVELFTVFNPTVGNRGTFSL